MVTTLNTKELLRSLTLLNKIVARRSSMPILSNVKIDLFDYFAKISGSDLDLSLSYTVGSELTNVTSQSSITVNCKALLDLVKLLGKLPEIKLSIDGYKLKINNTEIVGVPSTEYPDIFQELKGNLVQFNLDDNRQALKDCLISVSKDATRFNLNGVCLRKDRFVATNGHNLTQRKARLNQKTSLVDNAIIPSKFIEIVTSFKENGSFEIDGTDPKYLNKITFNSNKIKFSARLIDGTFPDCDQVLPKNISINVVNIDRDTLKQLAEQAASISTDKEKGARFTFNQENKLTVEASSPQLGKFSDTMNSFQSRGLGKDLSIGWNCNYLLDFLSTIPKTEKISIDLTGDLGPAILRGKDHDHSDMFILMPMRL